MLLGGCGQKSLRVSTARMCGTYRSMLVSLILTIPAVCLNLLESCRGRSQFPTPTRFLKKLTTGGGEPVQKTSLLLGSYPTLFGRQAPKRPHLGLGFRHLFGHGPGPGVDGLFFRPVYWAMNSQGLFPGDEAMVHDGLHRPRPASGDDVSPPLWDEGKEGSESFVGGIPWARKGWKTFCVPVSGVLDVFERKRRSCLFQVICS